MKWVETRSENIVAMAHGRGQVQYVELGLKRDGTIVGMRCRIVGDAGAYAGFGGMLPGMMTRIMASGCYRIPKIAFDVAVAITNTTPMGAYRGAGRPEAAAFVERIMDMAADELGIDPGRDAADGTCSARTSSRYTTVMGADVRQRRLRARPSTRRCGSPATTSSAPSRRSGAGAATGCSSGSASRCYVEITGERRRASTASVEVHDDGTVDGEGGHLRPRARATPPRSR